MQQIFRLVFFNKNIFLTLLILVQFNYLVGQSKYGIVAGGGKNSLYNFAYSPDDFNRYSPLNSWWAGITADLPISQNNLSFCFSSIYNEKGFNYALQKETGPNNTLKDSSFSQHIKYIDINPSLCKKFIFHQENTNNFFVATGPVLSLLATGKEQIQSQYFGTAIPSLKITNTKLIKGTGPGKYNPFFVSWEIMAGIEMNKFNFRLNVKIPVTDYYQDAALGIKHKIKSFGISIGYTILTHKKTERKIKNKKENKPIEVIVQDTVTDRDEDGIADFKDKCPGHKGTLKYGGCPVPDTDGDGINDDDDKCITLAGTPENKGCPEFTDKNNSDKNDSTCYTVYFEPGKSILRSEAYNILKNVVNQLKANPKLMVALNGHTDNVGSTAANYTRSLDRASVCAAYISSFFINKERIIINGFGNTRPVADLKDPLLQWKNRRVEVCLFEKKE
jgi:outer membrane protein OmpA-like peptidoglycan-associated protein